MLKQLKSLWVAPERRYWARRKYGDYIREVVETDRSKRDFKAFTDSINDAYTDIVNNKRFLWEYLWGKRYAIRSSRWAVVIGEIFKHHGSSITKLHWKYNPYDMKRFDVDLLRFLPALEEIEFSHVPSTDHSAVDCTFGYWNSRDFFAYERSRNEKEMKIRGPNGWTEESAQQSLFEYISKYKLRCLTFGKNIVLHPRSIMSLAVNLPPTLTHLRVGLSKEAKNWSVATNEIWAILMGLRRPCHLEVLEIYNYNIRGTADMSWYEIVNCTMHKLVRPYHVVKTLHMIRDLCPRLKECHLPYTRVEFSKIARDMRDLVSPVVDPHVISAFKRRFTEPFEDDTELFDDYNDLFDDLQLWTFLHNDCIIVPHHLPLFGRWPPKERDGLFDPDDVTREISYPVSPIDILKLP